MTIEFKISVNFWEPDIFIVIEAESKQACFDKIRQTPKYKLIMDWKIINGEQNDFQI